MFTSDYGDLIYLVIIGTLLSLFAYGFILFKGTVLEPNILAITKL